MERQRLARDPGAFVRRLRSERGYSQKMFGQVCKLDRTYVGMIERGEVNITVLTALKLADGLDLRLSQFFIMLERYLEQDK